MCGRTKIIASAQIFRPQSILPLPLPHLLTLLTKFVKINQGNIILIFISFHLTLPQKCPSFDDSFDNWVWIDSSSKAYERGYENPLSQIGLNLQKELELNQAWLYQLNNWCKLFLNIPAGAWWVGHLIINDFKIKMDWQILLKISTHCRSSKLKRRSQPNAHVVPDEQNIAYGKKTFIFMHNWL